jgi:drug/metabolite transporter (DMT)-like permease
VSRPHLPETTSRRGLLAGLVLGLPIMAFGVRGAVAEAARVHPAELARWIAGAAVVNDLVLLPAVLLAGRALRRVVPARRWPAVRTGLVASGVLALVSWPFVRGYGRSADNPSLLPRDYVTGVGAALVAVWLAVAAWVLAERWRRRRRGDVGPAGVDQPTPTRSTTKTSVSSGPITPPAPREP